MSYFNRTGLVPVLKFNPNHDAAGRFAKSAGTSLAKYAQKHNQASVSAGDIMARLSSNDRREIIDKIAEAERSPDTNKTFSDGHGNYTPERQVLHQKIINKYFTEDAIKHATPPEGKPPTYALIAGRGGSGKSAFTDGTLHEIDAGQFMKLDSDDIKAMLPEYKGWNAHNLHEESGHIFDMMHARAKALGLNIAHDVTLRSRVNEHYAADMRKSGYRIEGHYMYVPPHIAAHRVVQRYLNNGRANRGRLVPVNIVLGNRENEANFDHFKQHYFDKWSAYDNSAGGMRPKLIARGKTKS